MDDKDQSRKSATSILEIKKDIEHLKYILDEQEKDTTFLKNHISTKNSERLDDIKKLHCRMDKHLQTELEYQQSVRDKIVEEHTSIHKRIAQVERWVWVFFGGFTVISALLGKASFSSLFGG